MKIRSGFVSNSSSASFVLTVKDTSIDQFIYDAYDAANSSFFSFNYDLKKELEEQIESLKSDLKSNNNSKSFVFYSPESIKELIEENEALLKLINDENAELKDKILEVLSKRHQITVKYFSDFGDIEISGWTTMYNDDADIPEFIKLITAYYAKENVPVRLKVIED